MYYDDDYSVNDPEVEFWDPDYFDDPLDPLENW